MKSTTPKWKYEAVIDFTAPVRSINTIFLHCSASDNSSHDDTSVMKSWHVKRGFSDIGYHFFINKNGNIQEGRSIEKSPAAQKGHNSGSIAICCHGLKIDKFTDAQLASVKSLCKKIVDSYTKKIRIRGHREVSSKTCPVFDYKKLLSLNESGHMSSSVAKLPSPQVEIPAPVTTRPPVASKAHIIQLFDKGSKVMALQGVLGRLGFQCGRDGVFGQSTNQCVERFQRSKALTVDGIVGPKTVVRMFSSSKVLLRCESRGNDVAVLQLLLSMHGKHVIHDGVFGRGTKAILEAVQRTVRTKADGVFGPNTLKLMT